MSPKQKKEAGFYIILIILASISLFVKNKVTDQPIEALIQSITQAESEADPATEQKNVSQTSYTFRNQELLEEHYQKHGREMGFDSASEYEKAASAVVTDSRSLHKLEAEDGDDVYYLEASNEFVIVSKDGYIRTYFYPGDGKEYFDRQ